MFSKKDIKPGVLVQFDDGDYGIVAFTNGITGLATVDDEGFCLKLSDINSVYSFGGNVHAFLFGLENRVLLWMHEPEVKEVTMAEVEEKFGCKVKIIAKEEF